MAEEMNMGEVVMVVDDNKEIVYSISELLKYEGYRVIPAYDGMEALNLLEQNPVDLILLDVMMPRLNGLSALMKLREKYRIPVIILSAKTEESDKVSGLVLGADDYVEKPYNPAELMARVKAHLRRYRAWGGELPKENDDQIINGGLVLDKKQRIVLVEGEEVRLTATEYKILELLMEHPGQVFSSEQIYENVWQEFDNIMTFWQQKGVDGFRLDAVKYYYLNETNKNVTALSRIKQIALRNDPKAYIVGECWDSNSTIASYYQSEVDSYFYFGASQGNGFIRSSMVLIKDLMFEILRR